MAKAELNMIDRLSEVMFEKHGLKYAYGIVRCPGECGFPINITVTEDGSFKVGHNVLRDFKIEGVAEYVSRRHRFLVKRAMIRANRRG